MAEQLDRGPAGPVVNIAPVSSADWRAVAALTVTPEQRGFVAEPSYYLALCCFGEAGWRPLSMAVDGEVVGFLMWAIDPSDGSCWLGGVLVEAARQGHGIGRAGVAAALRHLSSEHGYRAFALSYHPENLRARRIYARLGFVETGERDGDEIVARWRLEGGADSH